MRRFRSVGAKRKADRKEEKTTQREPVMASPRLVNIPEEYFVPIPMGSNLFSPLYQFENGLRLTIHNFLATCYGTDWWEKSLKQKLPKVYEYAEEQIKKKARMPWIGDSSAVTVLPIHLVTLGHLEEIVKKYQSDCIPELFPTIHFFLGHMECIKRVRNLYAHMFPCLTKDDGALARSEIRVLAKHINTRL
jgi:hypothetical protein